MTATRKFVYSVVAMAIVFNLLLWYGVLNPSMIAWLF
jgi:hypothetical protein